MNLYNKYRPKTFAEVIQPYVSPALQYQIKNNTHVSTYMFSGGSGVGKTTLSRIMAMALLCDNRQENGDPCGKCESCKTIINNNNRDVIEINCSDINGVDDMRERIIQSMRLSPIGEYRVYILDEAQRLSSAAQNSLLKTLEEPPSYVRFFICTTEPHKILPTIQTRCQHFRLLSLNNNDLLKIIQNIVQLEQIEYEEEALNTIAQSANGSARTAIAILEQSSAIGVTEDNVRNILGRSSVSLAVNLLKSISENNKGEAIRLIDASLSAGKNPVMLLEECIRVLLEIIKYRLKVNNEINNLYKDIRENYKGAQCMLVASLLLETISQIKTNTPGELMIPIAILKIIDKYTKQKEMSKPV